MTDAAVNAKVDDLFGFKENVIMGHIIPAGTGYRGIKEVVYDKAELDLTLKESKTFDLEDIKNELDNSEEKMSEVGSEYIEGEENSDPEVEESQEEAQQGEEE